MASLFSTEFYFITLTNCKVFWDIIDAFREGEEDIESVCTQIVKTTKNLLINPAKQRLKKQLGIW